MVEATKLKPDGLEAAGDDFYEMLMGLHDGLSFEESTELNARLILLMANQVGDLDTLQEIFETARTPTQNR